MTRRHPARHDDITLQLDLTAWDGVLAGLGSAAELTTAYLALTCDQCGSDIHTCPTHDADWDNVDRWRALATTLRDQLTAQPPTQTTSAS